MLLQRAGYTQLYRNGIFESVISISLKSAKFIEPVCNLALCEFHIIKALKEKGEALKYLQIEPPIIIMVSMISVKEHIFLPYTDELKLILNHSLDKFEGMKHENILLPSAQWRAWDEDLPGLMRPTFDVMWNAGGYPKSWGYTENGTWKRGEI